MARVVVVGGGFAGMAAAARLAKTGHEVTLLERSARLGGALGSESMDGFTWDAGPSYTLLPAVIRDLFRKSGRPVERELDLEPVEVIREHRFEDRSRVRIHGGSRGAQLAAFEELGSGLGQQRRICRQVVRRKERKPIAGGVNRERPGRVEGCQRIAQRPAFEGEAL